MPVNPLAANPLDYVIYWRLDLARALDAMVAAYLDLLDHASLPAEVKADLKETIALPASYFAVAALSGDEIRTIGEAVDAANRQVDKLRAIKNQMSKLLSH